MNTLPFLTAESARQPPNWKDAVEALVQGHQFPEAAITDSTLARGEQRLMSRMAWIEGLGAAVKTFSVYPENPGGTPPRPSVQGGCVLFDDASGAPTAIVDFAWLTRWKTAADSVLGALTLGPRVPRQLVVIGAGPIAQALCEAYCALFPSLAKLTICARHRDSAERCAARLAVKTVELKTSETPADCIPTADIVVTATTSETPVLAGRWLKPGAHVDLVGAYAADMREADDATLKRGKLYVDSRATTIDHIGELLIPLGNGTLDPSDIRADFYELLASGGSSEHHHRLSDDITVFKNGGGAHLDLMMGHYLQSLCC